MMLDLDTSKFKTYSVYKDFKNIILGDNFTWTWMNMTTYKSSTASSKGIEDHDNFGHYYHNFLTRPLRGVCNFPHSPSEYSQHAHSVVTRLLEINNIDLNVIYRMTANCSHPTESGKPNIPHIDHRFPHKNLLIYIDGCDGDTICGEDVKHFGEDCAIIFEGEHYHYPPSKGRRIVFVATFI